MAEKVQPKFLIPRITPTACTAKQNTKRKTIVEKATNKKRLDKERSQTRVNIGIAFQRWRQLRELKGLKSDAMVAVFLLDRYEKDSSASTPSKHGLTRQPPPAVSSIVAECLSDRDDDFSVVGVEELDNSSDQETAIPQVDVSIDWEDDTCNPIYKETESVSSLEEDETGEVDTDYDDSDDEDYMPPPRICTRTGGALKTQICVDALPTISTEDSVHNAVDNSQDPTTADIPPLPETAKVEDDIIGHPASITYHDCLKQLAEYVVLPVNMCTAKDPNTKVECRAPRPFEINIKSRGTAAIVEWICPHGHTVWKWTSQPTLKHGMLVGDFLLASNILLSGNTYAKISLLFKFMKMGMVEKSSLFRMQDSYCVDTIKDFWNEKRAEMITQLQSKGPVVALGDARMDSPGFCAQYCTYTATDNESKQIICMVNTDKLETLRNSVVMEKEGFTCTLPQELNITEICTDAHNQISALFNKGKCKDSGDHHTLDIWQGSKSLGRDIPADQEHFEESCPAEQPSSPSGTSSVPPPSQVGLGPSRTRNTTSKKMHLSKRAAEINHHEEQRPATQDQDHSTAPTETSRRSESDDELSSSHEQLHEKPSEEPKQYQGPRRPKKNYNCPTCGKVFAHNHSLQRHLVIHSGKRPFKCFICGRGFTQSGNLKTHMKVHRGELPNWTLVQEKRPPKESAVTVHMCGECGMDFPEKQQLEEHSESHKKPYACPDCGKTFKNENYFKLHQRSHSRDSPFVCSVCGRSCVTADALKRHELTHTGEKNFHCEQCGRAFSQVSHLNMHRKTHRGERPHLCAICGKSYSKACALKAHLRVHTGEKPYTCEKCGKCYYYTQGYRTHLKTHDKKPKPPSKPLGRPKQQLLEENNH